MTPFDNAFGPFQAVKQDRRLTHAGLRDVEAAVKATMEADAGSRSLKAAAQAEAEAAAVPGRGCQCPEQLRLGVSSYRLPYYGSLLLELLP